jgi:hypothetical protein
MLGELSAIFNNWFLKLVGNHNSWALINGEFEMATIDGTGEVSPTDSSFVTVETTVYNLVKRENGFVMVPVGTVALGTACDITQTVNSYFVVPYVAGQIAWFGTVKPVVVVGSCSAN